MCGPSWSTSPSPPPRPGSPPLGDRRSGAKTPWKTPSTLRSASRAIPSPSRSRSTNTINGCPGRAARRGVVGPVVAARAKSAPVPPSSYRKNRLRHLPTGRFRRSDHSPLVRTGLNRALTASPKEVILRLKRLDFLSLAAESILYIALLYRLWNFQVPMWLFKIKNSFIEEIEKATFNLFKSLIFKKMPPQKVFSL
jgi:hypothetical protein